MNKEHKEAIRGFTICILGAITILFLPYLFRIFK